MSPEAILSDLGEARSLVSYMERPSAPYSATLRERDFIDEVKYRKGLSDDFRAPIAEKIISNHYLYDNVTEKVGDFFSNISVPWPFRIVQTYVGRAFLELCQDMPYVEIVEDWDAKREASRRVQKSINRELYIQRYPYTALHIYKDVFIRGTDWLAYRPWSIYKGYEMPVLFKPNWFRIWPNPNVSSLEDEDAYIIHENFVRLDRLLEDFGGNPAWKNLDSIEPVGENPTDMWEDRYLSILELPTKKFDRYSKLVKLTHYWTHRQYGVIANDNICIRDTANPIGIIPYKDLWIVADDRSIYKPSLFNFGKDLFAELNEKRNQRIDAVNLLLNPQWIAGSMTKPNVNKLPAVPGWISHIGIDVAQLKPVPVDWNILAASHAEEAFTVNDIRGFSNLQPTFEGAPGPRRETATVGMLQEKHGVLQSDVYNFLLNMLSIEDLANDYVYFHRLFMTHRASFNDPFSGELVYAMPEDFEGEFTFKAIGSMLGARDMERRDFLGLMNIIFTNPIMASGAMSKMQEWVARAMDYFRIRSPKELYEGLDQVQFDPNQIMALNQMMGGRGQGGPGMLPAGAPKPQLIGA